MRHDTLHATESLRSNFFGHRCLIVVVDDDDDDEEVAAAPAPRNRRATKPQGVAAAAPAAVPKQTGRRPGAGGWGSKYLKPAKATDDAVPNYEESMGE